MTAEILHPDFAVNPSAKEAMDRPIDYSRLAKLQGDVVVAQIRWWRGLMEEWQRFFEQWWQR